MQALVLIIKYTHVYRLDNVIVFNLPVVFDNKTKFCFQQVNSP